MRVFTGTILGFTNLPFTGRSLYLFAFSQLLSQRNGLPVAPMCDGMPTLHEATLALVPPLAPARSPVPLNDVNNGNEGALGGLLEVNDGDAIANNLVATTRMFAHPVFHGDGTRPVLKAIEQGKLREYVVFIALNGILSWISSGHVLHPLI